MHFFREGRHALLLSQNDPKTRSVAVAFTINCKGSLARAGCACAGAGHARRIEWRVVGGETPSTHHLLLVHAIAVAGGP